MRSLARRLCPGALLLVVGLLHSPPAAACSIAAPPVIADSLPSNGAMDVPLNVRPIIVGDIASLDVVDAEGNSVDFDVSEESQAIVVIFDDNLAPNTEYVMHVGGGWEAEAELRFTTGTETHSDEVAEVTEWTVSGLTTMYPDSWVFFCSSPNSFLCVDANIPEHHALVIETKTEFDDIGRMFLTSGFDAGIPFASAVYNWPDDSPTTQLLTGGWDPDSCVTLSLQNISGERGPRREVCPGDFPVHEPSSLSFIDCSGGELSYEPSDIVAGPEERPTDDVTDDSDDGSEMSVSDDPGDPDAGPDGDSDSDPSHEEPSHEDEDDGNADTDGGAAGTSADDSHEETDKAVSAKPVETDERGSSCRFAPPAPEGSGAWLLVVAAAFMRRRYARRSQSSNVYL